MQNYKDKQNKLYSIESSDFEYLLPTDCVLITAKEANIIANPPKTREQEITVFTTSIQAHLDDTAKAKGYDDILSACSYASAPNPFQDEAVKLVGWRGNVWEYCYNELAKVESGVRSMPELDTFIKELPVL